LPPWHAWYLLAKQMQDAGPRDDASVVALASEEASVMVAFESELDVWNGQLGQVGAQSVGVGGHGKVEITELDAGQVVVVVADCRIETVDVVGRH